MKTKVSRCTVAPIFFSFNAWLCVSCRFFVKKLKKSTMTHKRCCQAWWNFSLAFCHGPTTLLFLCRSTLLVRFGYGCVCFIPTCPSPVANDASMASIALIFCRPAARRPPTYVLVPSSRCTRYPTVTYRPCHRAASNLLETSLSSAPSELLSAEPVEEPSR